MKVRVASLTWYPSLNHSYLEYSVELDPYLPRFAHPVDVVHNHHASYLL